MDPDDGDEGSPSGGSGWWYEGGGLYRRVTLARAGRVHVARDGLFATSTFASDRSTARVTIQADVANAGDVDVDADVVLSVGAQNATVRLSLPAGTSATAIANVSLNAPTLWTASEPYLYDVRATVLVEGTKTDFVSTSHGVRAIRYDADDGFFLNEEHFKVRGFCDHNTFGVVGMAVPDRVNLFRAQASRSVGGNGRRMSHNPPDPAMLDIYDRVGVVVMDENRLFANSSKYVENMGTLVKRDRNHPSVILWSFCNEVGCEGDREAGGPSFREVTYEYDGSRPVRAPRRCHAAPPPRRSYCLSTTSLRLSSRSTDHTPAGNLSRPLTHSFLGRGAGDESWWRRRQASRRHGRRVFW